MKKTLLEKHCWKSGWAPSHSINSHRFTTANSYLGHHETEDCFLMFWIVCSASINLIVISVIGVVWSLYLSLSLHHTIADLFCWVSEGENWRGGEFFSVFVCSRMWQTEVLTAYTWAPTQGGHCCSAKPSKFVYHAPDMESQKWTVVFSSLLWAQQSVCFYYNSIIKADRRIFIHFIVLQN